MLAPRIPFQPLADALPPCRPAPRCPASGMERAVLLHELRDQGKLPEAWQQQHPNVARLIRWLMSPKPGDRPSAREVLASDLLPPRLEDEQVCGVQYVCVRACMCVCGWGVIKGARHRSRSAWHGPFHLLHPYHHAHAWLKHRQLLVDRLAPLPSLHTHVPSHARTYTRKHTHTHANTKTRSQKHTTAFDPPARHVLRYPTHPHTPISPPYTHLYLHPRS